MPQAQTHSRPSPDALRDLLFSLCRAAAPLPRFSLYPEERIRLAGSAFVEAPELVEAVCRAVDEGAALLQDLPFDPDAVRQGQARARRYGELHALLRYLATRAHDLFLFEQAAATEQAMAVLRTGRCRLAEPHHGPAHRQLDDALRPAEAILEGRADAARGARHRSRRSRRRPRFCGLGFIADLRAASQAARRAGAATARPAAAPRDQKDAIAPGALARPPSRPISPPASTSQGAPMAPQIPMTPMTPMTPTTPTPPPVVATGIAATTALRAVRVDAAETSADLRFPRLSSEQRAETGATLSADEMEAAEALVRLFDAEGGLGDEAGVQPDLFGHTLAVDRALCGLGRAAGQLEATAAVGEIVTSAQLTELCDGIFEIAEDPALPAEARARCDSLLASTAELTARREQLLAGRKARSALRRTRQAAEREEATKETERLRAHNQIISETRGR